MLSVRAHCLGPSPPPEHPLMVIMGNQYLFTNRLADIELLYKWYHLALGVRDKALADSFCQKPRETGSRTYIRTSRHCVKPGRRLWSFSLIHLAPFESGSKGGRANDGWHYKAISYHSIWTDPVSYRPIPRPIPPPFTVTSCITTIQISNQSRTLLMKFPQYPQCGAARVEVRVNGVNPLTNALSFRPALSFCTDSFTYPRLTREHEPT